MTDLLLQDLENLNNERLVLILSNEKGEMLGERRVPAKEMDASSSFPGSVTKARKKRKGGGKRYYKVKP